MQYFVGSAHVFAVFWLCRFATKRCASSAGRYTACLAFVFVFIFIPVPLFILSCSRHATLEYVELVQSVYFRRMAEEISSPQATSYTKVNG